MNITTFKFRKYAFLVKLIDGYCVFRQDVLDGPWSDVEGVVNNKFYEPRFRLELRKACDQLKSAQSV